MRELSVTEQRYKAVLAVIGDGRAVSEVATDWGVLGERCTGGWCAMRATDWKTPSNRTLKQTETDKVATATQALESDIAKVVSAPKDPDEAVDT